MRTTIVLYTVLVAHQGLSQSSGTMDFDTSQLKTRITLDRHTYLPGEVAKVSLEVSNPANVPVTTLAPFLSDTGCLYLRQRKADRLLGIPTPEQCGSVDVSGANTVTFGPGETKRLVLNSYDPMFDSGDKVMEGGAVPEIAGSFGISYRYGSSVTTVEYAVAPSKLEAHTTVRVQDLMFTDHPDTVPPQPIPMYIHVFSLRAGDTSHVCVQQAPVTMSDPPLPEENTANGMDFDLTHIVNIAGLIPFKRVASSANPIVRLHITADRDENLNISWVDALGNERSVYYPASFPARPPRNRK